MPKEKTDGGTPLGAMGSAVAVVTRGRGFCPSGIVEEISDPRGAKPPKAVLTALAFSGQISIPETDTYSIFSQSDRPSN